MFHNFELESCCDKLKLKSLVSGISSFERELTGALYPNRYFISDANRFVMLFRSGGSVSKSGFRASYSTIPSCTSS